VVDHVKCVGDTLDAARNWLLLDHYAAVPLCSPHQSVRCVIGHAPLRSVWVE
jgi:hypothetical protein